MKILGITSIRSDYDLLSSLYTKLHEDHEIELKLLVSGAHLSKNFGFSKKQIESDNLDILLEIETLISSDTPKSRLKTASILLQNSIDVVSFFNPDLILYAGDREDVIIGGLLSMYLNIPSIHFYGGDHEKDMGNDTYIRHATSKLSSLHFVSNEMHKKRLISLGESEKRIFNIGSISLDRLFKYNKLNIQEILSRNIPLNYALMIFHPMENEDSKMIFKEILSILKEKKIFTIVSYPNSDPNHQGIIELIEEFINYKDEFYFYKNLSRDVYLTIFNNCQFIIGNSSAGIYEAATLKKFAVNVGLRQKDRLKSDNIIYCSSNKTDIEDAINFVINPTNKNILDNVVNPFGDGHSSEKAYLLIKKIDFKNFLIKDEDPLELINE